jgi:hypothetical protein
MAAPPPLTPLPTLPAGVTSNDWYKIHADLYKLEYERAAIRYNDIYQAIWQIFSYMSVISGAVLTFGGERFQKNALFSLVCLPLVFWYLAIFVPHDHYGENCFSRLKKIEEEVAGKYGVPMAHYRGFGDAKKISFWPPRCPVKYVVHPVFFLLTLVFAWQLMTVYDVHNRKEPLLIEKKQEVKIVTVSADELEKLLASRGVKAPEAQPSSTTAGTKAKN